MRAGKLMGSFSLNQLFEHPLFSIQFFFLSLTCKNILESVVDIYVAYLYWLDIDFFFCYLGWIS